MADGFRDARCPDVRHQRYATRATARMRAVGRLGERPRSSTLATHPPRAQKLASRWHARTVRDRSVREPMATPVHEAWASAPSDAHTAVTGDGANDRPAIQLEARELRSAATSTPQAFHVKHQVRLHRGHRPVQPRASGARAGDPSTKRRLGWPQPRTDASCHPITLMGTRALGSTPSPGPALPGTPT